ncbi:MAG: MFS transporter [Firmicutes bacterium]|nr:MFS transporter [Bacillota bacterium]
MTLKRKDSLITFLQVFSFALISGMTTAISPLMQMLIEHFSEVPVTAVRMLSNIVSLCGMCVSVPLSLFFGNRLRFKPLLILGSCLFLLGSLPYFEPDPSFALVMFARVCVGIGFGFCALRNACVRRMFAGDDAAIARWLGIMNATVSIVGVLLGPLAGALADRFGLWHGFLVYLLASVSLVLLTFVFKEPEREKDEAAASAAKAAGGIKGPASAGNTAPAQAASLPSAERTGLPAIVFRFAAVCAFTTLLEYPIFTLSSTLAGLRGWGGAAVGGSIISCFSFGNMSGSLFYPVQNRVMPRRGLSMDYLLMFLGFGLMLTAPGLPIAMAAAFMLGFGFTNQMLSHTKWAGDAATPATRTFASTLLPVSVSLGSFLSAFWIPFVSRLASSLSFLEAEVDRVYFVSMLVYAVFTAVFFVFDPRPKKA